MSHALFPSHLVARDGLKLHLSHWPVASPKGVVVLLHGLSEHGLRYAETARHVNEAGWIMLAPDIRGNGQSEGPRGAIRQDDDYLHDLAAVLDLVEQTCPGLPRVVLGHSMGGALAARFASAQALPREEAPWARPLSGLILSAPALQPTMSLVQKALLSTMGRLILDVAVPVAFKTEWINSDPAVVEEINNDPLSHKKITPRVALFMAGQGPTVMRRAPSWTVPTLMLYTPDDRLVMKDGCERFMKALPADLSTLRAFPGLKHDLLREPGRGQVYQALQQWLKQTFPT
ncbi:MAG: alpha/beta hydrolase [Aquabacterium sp.]|uniref:alpha/beta hydrolase n=1 Tax=Aquabacterium sp. TaxID=1872578 RepID=UPI001217EC62|nr:alpha/beta hydrolase [Aquabacterium sp.]TAK93781.1 MAG: alpha/beta hydrolase [Aquabacterium sp.]